MKYWMLWVLLLIPSLSFPQDFTLQLDNVRVADVSKIVYGDVLRRSFVLDDEVMQSPDAVTLNWRALSAPQLDAMARELLRLRGFEIQTQGTILVIRKRKDEDAGVMVYQPRNRSARYLSDILAKVARAQSLGTRSMQGSPAMQQAAQTQPAQVGNVAAVISQSASDQLAYECMPLECKRLRSLLVQLDTPEAQVVLRAAIYEVGTTRGEGSAMQVAAKLFKGSLILAGGNSIIGSASATLKGATLDAVFSVLDQDGRFRSVSKPMLRVKTGTQAKFSVGQQVPILGAITQDKNGNPMQSVEYKPSGTILTVQPDVRLDFIDLNVTQELSSFVQTTTGVNNSPTLLQRTATSQLSIRSGEVIVFAGLEEAREDDARSGLFGLSLGKKQNRTTSEVLVFIEAQRI